MHKFKVLNILEVNLERSLRYLLFLLQIAWVMKNNFVISFSSKNIHINNTAYIETIIFGNITVYTYTYVHVITMEKVYKSEKEQCAIIDGSLWREERKCNYILYIYVYLCISKLSFAKKRNRFERHKGRTIGLSYSGLKLV